MSLLMRNATVTTRYGGGFVESVDGLSGGERGRTAGRLVLLRQRRRGAKGAAATNVHPGDHIWWDLHDWSQTDSVPAVVGSFPEPFLNGIGGKRLPVRIECATVAEHAVPDGQPRACARSASRPRIAAIGAGGEPETLRVLVGPWTALRGDPAAHEIELGPRASGVYARFPRAAARSRCSSGRGRHRAHPHRRRGPDRGHALRRRSARVGGHRHRRRRRRSWRRSARQGHAWASLRGGAGPRRRALPAPAPVSAGG